MRGGEQKPAFFGRAEKSQRLKASPAHRKWGKTNKKKGGYCSDTEERASTMAHKDEYQIPHRGEQVGTPKGPGDCIRNVDRDHGGRR